MHLAFLFGISIHARSALIQPLEAPVNDKVADCSRILGLTLLLSLAPVCGCTHPPDRAFGGMAALKTAAAPSAARNTLAREHSLSVEVVERELPGAVNRILAACVQTPTTHCTVLRSDLSAGKEPSANLRFRLAPTDISSLRQVISTVGDIVRDSTRAEDLADVIADTQTRLQMEVSYRKQLVEMQAKAGGNIDAAIKIASELSHVQGDIERISIEADIQKQRVETETLDVDLSTGSRRAFLKPVRESLSDFSTNLSNGVAQAVTAVAYILPWSAIFLPLLFLIRFLWRRRRAG